MKLPAVGAYVAQVLQRDETAANDSACKAGAIGDLRLTQVRVVGVEGANDVQPARERLHEVGAVFDGGWWGWQAGCGI